MPYVVDPFSNKQGVTEVVSFGRNGDKTPKCIHDTQYLKLETGEECRNRFCMYDRIDAK